MKYLPLLTLLVFAAPFGWGETYTCQYDMMTPHNLFLVRKTNSFDILVTTPDGQKDEETYKIASEDSRYLRLTKFSEKIANYDYYLNKESGALLRLSVNPRPDREPYWMVARDEGTCAVVPE